MKIHFLGTCAGTEPIPNRKHASIVIESKGILYWFDAGETCSRTAHLMGLDLLKVRKIVISHTHMDHVGGLGNLLWNIRKCGQLRKEIPEAGRVDIHIPNMESWDGIMLLLRNSEGGFKTEYPIQASLLEEGLLFDDGNMRVTAIPNTHLNYAESDKCLSFSFMIECEEKKLIYSGDLGKLEDLDAVISAGSDGLIIETGHFGIDAVQQYMLDKKTGRIFFSHNGREILNYPEEAREKVKKYFGEFGLICEDGMTVDF